MQTTVSIGMLAHNEAERIEKAIASLFAQSVFSSREDDALVEHWQFIILPNGCSDNTAEIAASALAELLPKLKSATIKSTIYELKEGGKSNAWNYYIHQLADKHADFLILLDSDIELAHSDTILNCLRTLYNDPTAIVSVDLPLKDFEKKKRLNLLQSISLKTSRIQLKSQAALSGQFYCARALPLRQVWMPDCLSGEDGFLHAMIITDQFRSEPVASRVVRAPDASHYYEGLTTLRSIFRHELRMVIGTALNCYLMWDFLVFATHPAGVGAGKFVRDQLEANPAWYKTLMKNQIRNRGWWVIPTDMTFRRFNSLATLHWSQRLRRIPLALIGTIFDIPIFWLANRKLKNGSAIGFW